MDEASSITGYAPSDYELLDDHRWLQRGRWLVLQLTWKPTAYGRSGSLRDPVTHVIRRYYRARHLDRGTVETLTVWYCGRRSVVCRRVRRPRGVCPDCVAALVRSRRASRG